MKNSCLKMCFGVGGVRARGLIPLLACLILVPLHTAFGFTGGDGSAGNPYQVSTRADLEAVNGNLAAHYVLLNDINLSGVPYDRAVIAPYMDASSPTFTGSFDGNGKVIRNLSIVGGGHSYLGLFGRIDMDGSVFDLGMEDVDVSGFLSAGGLVGNNYQNPVVRCYASGTVTGTRLRDGCGAGSQYRPQ